MPAPINTSLSIRLFGGPTDQAGRNTPNTSNQKQGETVTTAGSGVGRAFKGPSKVGHFSLMLGVTEASAGGGVTVWYSNLPNPNPDLDADWVQDTTVGTLVTTATGVQFQNVGNVFAEWVRVKCLPTGDTCDIWCYVRSEGEDTP